MDACVPDISACLEEQTSIFYSLPGVPSKPAIGTMLNKLKNGRLLKLVRAGSGRRPQVLALAELINLCEGKKLF